MSLSPSTHARSRARPLSRPILEVMRGREAVAVLTPDATLAEAVVLVGNAATGCGVVVDGQERPVGVLTTGDIARRVALRCAADVAVSHVMTTPARTIHRRDFLLRAIALMRRHGLGQLPTIDRDGRLVGVITLTDALAGAAGGVMARVDGFAGVDVEELRASKAAAVELAADLMAEGVAASEIQRLLARVHNDIYRTLGERNLAAMSAEGWGGPPVAMTTIVMGSAGRDEVLLFPDQDNAFILADYPDDAHDRIDGYFRELAERICRDLDAAGIRYCQGGCMATNPLWRKTASQWRDQLRSWIRRADTIAVRLADVFLDLQPVWGPTRQARELRALALTLVRANPFFLKQMFRDQQDKRVALGPLGGFVTEKERPGFRGQIDLKRLGLMPLTSAVRLLAVREGIEDTSTLDRLANLARAGVIGHGEERRLFAAFECLGGLLLERQIEDHRNGRPPGHHVAPDRLDRRRRKQLQTALRAIEGLRNRLHLEFTAQIF